MPACEKCWRDSQGVSMYGADGVSEYRRLLRERDVDGKRCTPEEQAGPDATECPECNRMTAHQHCRICMACGYNPEPDGHSLTAHPDTKGENHE